MRKILLLLSLALTAIAPAFGQGSAAAAAPVAVNQSGAPLPGTLVTICTTNPGTGACGVKVSTFTDITLGTACSGSLVALNNLASPSTGSGCSNPGFTDGLGNVVVFANAGAYWCQYSGATITTYSQPCPFPGTGAGTFSALGGGINTSQAMGLGGTASMVPTGLGQVTANGLFLSSAGLAGVPIPPSYSMTTANSGGSLPSGNTLYTRASFQVGAQEGTATPETAVILTSGVGFACVSGSACQLTIVAPTFPPGVTGWNGFSGTSPGSELKVAGCTNLGAGVNCVINVGAGAGSAPLTSQTPTVLPNFGSSIVNDCNLQAQPWMYILGSDGKAHAAAMIDMVTNITQAPNGPNIGGTLHFCRRTMFDDSGYNGGNLFPLATSGRASAFHFTHYSGINQGQGCCPPGSLQDDRTIGFQNWSPAGDNSVRTGAQFGLYGESGIYGHPTLAATTGTNTTVSSFRSNTFLQSDQNGFAAQGSFFGMDSVLEIDNGSIGGSESGAIHGTVSFPTGTMVATQSQVVSAFVADEQNVLATNQVTLYVGFHSRKPTGNRPAQTFAILADDQGTNTSDWGIFANSSAANSSKNGFGGPVLLNQGILGGIATTAITGPITGNDNLVVTCVTTCTATYSYQLVPKDIAGGWAPTSGNLSTVIGATTLNGSNFNTINITTGFYLPAVGTTYGTYSYSVYRTASSGTPATTGFIGNVTCEFAGGCAFVDNGIAISTPTTDEPVTPLNTNTSGAIAPLSVRDPNNCKKNTASPAACGAAWSGTVVIPNTQTTYTVNTSKISTNSEIFLQYTTDATGLPGAPTCTVPSTLGGIYPSARVPGTSFTFVTPSQANNQCVHWRIVN